MVSRRMQLLAGLPLSVLGARSPSNLHLSCSQLFLSCPQRQQIPDRTLNTTTLGNSGGTDPGETAKIRRDLVVIGRDLDQRSNGMERGV